MRGSTHPAIQQCRLLGRRGFVRASGCSIAAATLAQPQARAADSGLLAGQTKPKKALDDMAAAWERITNRYGRESQKALYLASFTS